MEDHELVAGSYANSATLANTALLILDNLRARPASTLKVSHQRSLGSLDNLLRGSANGAKSIARGSALSPSPGRSLTDDLARYSIVTKVKRDLEPKELASWTSRAAKLVKHLETKGFAELDSGDKEWIAQELEPFLDELAQLDGSTAEDEFEVQSQNIAAA
jgi:hypothetical protein